MSRKTSAAAAELSEPIREVRTITTREFRRTLARIIADGAPVIVTHGRRIAGVFFPGNINTWRRDESRTAAVEQIRDEFPHVKAALE